MLALECKSKEPWPNHDSERQICDWEWRRREMSCLTMLRIE